MSEKKFKPNVGYQSHSDRNTVVRLLAANVKNFRKYGKSVWLGQGLLVL